MKQRSKQLVKIMEKARARQRITFLSPPEGTNENGFRNRADWKTHATVWAELRTLKGRQFHEAAQTHLENYRHFRIRYRKDLHDNMRVLYNGQIHQLAAPIENVDGLNKFMDVRVKKV